jgi:uncharacterized membrane protein
MFIVQMTWLIMSLILACILAGVWWVYMRDEWRHPGDLVAAIVLVIAAPITLPILSIWFMLHLEDEQYRD